MYFTKLEWLWAQFRRQLIYRAIIIGLLAVVAALLGLLLARREAAKAAVVARYQRRAPALAGFIETEAKKHNLEIPESQPRSPVPHGKEFEERSERFTLRKVDLLSLVKFMEGIAQSGYPVTISELNLRKRSADSYDVTVVISAFDRHVAERSEPEVNDSGDGGEDEEAPDEEEL